MDRDPLATFQSQKYVRAIKIGFLVRVLSDSDPIFAVFFVFLLCFFFRARTLSFSRRCELPFFRYLEGARKLRHEENARFSLCVDFNWPLLAGDVM